MAGRHTHGPAVQARTPRAVLAVVAVLLALVALAMLSLWPDDTPRRLGTPSASHVSGVVESIEQQPCAGPFVEDPPPDAAGVELCGSARVRLTSGESAGRTVSVALPEGIGAPTFEVGDEVGEPVDGSVAGLEDGGDEGLLAERG